MKFTDWTLWASVVSLGIIIIYILYLEQRETPTAYLFQKKRKHVYIRSVGGRPEKRSAK